MNIRSAFWAETLDGRFHDRDDGQRRVAHQGADFLTEFHDIDGRSTPKVHGLVEQSKFSIELGSLLFLTGGCPLKGMLREELCGFASPGDA